MRETAADLARLQDPLDTSARGPRPFLRSSFQIPERSLTAVQLAARPRTLYTYAA
jgi:hypothetical protein